MLLEHSEHCRRERKKKEQLFIYLYICTCVFLTVFVLDRPPWPGTRAPPASVPQVLVLQIQATVPGLPLAFVRDGFVSVYVEQVRSFKCSL